MTMVGFAEVACLLYLGENTGGTQTTKSYCAKLLYVKTM